ncbi:MAG: VWA domain-containing protein [Bacteroidota bacterium]|nr:VWA domain-containing protein [Bacteroidota bacterium]
MKFIRIIIVIFIISMLNISIYAQNQKKGKSSSQVTRILFIFDASYSMTGEWQSGKKIDIAKNLLFDLLDSINSLDNVEIGLRVYGHQKVFPPQDCNDTKLEIPFMKNNASRIKAKLKTIVPKGTTPIAHSLEEAANDFPSCSNCRNLIILITDGIEECKGDPCEVSQSLQKKGIFLKPFVIGIGNNFKNFFDCVGTYFDASTEKGFKDVLRVVVSQAINNTTAQVNLLDINGKPTETNVNMTFYDKDNEQIKYNYMHTLNTRGLPDTIQLDPEPTYKMFVHTIPQVTLDSIKLNPGRHNIIAVDAPQGYLLLKMTGNTNQSLPCIVRKSKKMSTLNVQNTNTTEKYIVGKYDLEFLSLPRMKVEDVSIKQSYTTTVEIPQPGLVNIFTSVVGYGSIYLEEENKLKWVYNLRENSTQETVYLLPGNYRVIFRAKSATQTIYTKENSFKVESGKSFTLKLFN